jgi:outer membrane receptor protein involved in Fe transport
VALESSLTSPIAQISQFSGQFGNESPNNQYGIYFQDDWNVNQHLTFNLGLRYDLVTGFNIDQSSSSLFQGLHNSPETYSWLASFQDSPDGHLHNDTNNIAPRIGAVYDWNADGVTVIRGGFGIYYDFPYTNANILFPQAALGTYGQSYNNADPNGICNVPRDANGNCSDLFQIGDPLPQSTSRTSDSTE